MSNFIQTPMAIGPNLWPEYYTYKRLQRPCRDPGMGLKRRFGSSSPLCQDGQAATVKEPHSCLYNRIRFFPSRHYPERTGRWTDLRRLNCLNVGKAPAQSCGDDQNYGDHTEISGLLSSRRMLLHVSDHQEFVLTLLRYDLQRTLLARLVLV